MLAPSDGHGDIHAVPVKKKRTVITIRTSVFTERIVGSNVKTVQYQITVKPY